MALTFTVDGNSMYADKIQAFKYNDELIWSENTRRTSSAVMTGDLKASKYKLEISYSGKLTQAELKNIKMTLFYGKRNPTVQEMKKLKKWHTVSFTCEYGEILSGKKMYLGTWNVEPYWFVNGQMKYQSVQITLIEK